MGCQQLQPWLDTRLELPVGPLFCIVTGASRGRHWANAAARADLRRTAARAGVRRRFAPHQLRHAHAVEMAHEGVPLVVIQRQLGHSNLGITSIYLQGIDNAEIIDTVHARPTPTVQATALLPPCRDRLPAEPPVLAHCSTLRRLASSAPGRRLREPIFSSRRGP